MLVVRRGRKHDLEFNSPHDCHRSSDHCSHHLCHLALSTCRSQQTAVSPANRPSVDRAGTGGHLSVLFCRSSVHVRLARGFVAASSDGIHGHSPSECQLVRRSVRHGAISSGFIELRRTQIELAEKNELLADLSSKLAKFLPAQLYNSIFAGGHSARVAAKRKKLTIFFSDIANFTETTDSLESEELTNLLNQYLTEMSKIAISHGATIDKYVGDAIMAFFGDPTSRGSKEDAIACVKMAIAMQRRLRELQLNWLDLGSEKPFQLRVGINTGFCTVGNFGSEDRMDYTIVGNEVNLAARLQSHAELGGILVAHETSSLIKDTILTEEQEPVSVKGFAHPVRVHKVVGIYDELEKDSRIIREERQGVRLLVDLTKGDLASAIAAVENVLARLRS
jgi:adenylate cyclase